MRYGTISEPTTGGVLIDGVILKGDTNTLVLSSGTAILDLAPACTVNVDKGLTVNGSYATTLASEGQANIVTLNESLTVGDGSSGTLTFSAASKTLTVADSASVNQDVQTTAGPTFDHVHVGGAAFNGGTNTFNITNGTASLDVAAGSAVNVDKSLTVNGSYGTTLASEGQANTITLNENFTVGNGSSGTLTFSAASKTLTVADNAAVNQDVQTTAGPTFDHLHTASIIAPAAAFVVKPTTDGTTAIQLSDKDGNAILTVDTTNDRVGIGTTNPGAALQLGAGKGIRLEASANNQQLINVKSPNFDTDLIRVGSHDFYTGSDYGFSVRYMGTRTGNYNSFSIFADNLTGSAVEAVTILQDGNLGIGTTSPGEKLEVAGNLLVKLGAASGSIRIWGKTDNSVQGTFQYINGSGILLTMEKEDDTETVRIRSYGESYFNGGNVGIGTTGPSEPLHIKTNEAGAGTSMFRLDNSGTAGNEVGMEFWTAPTDSATGLRTGRIYGIWDGGSYVNARLTLQSMTTGNVLVDTVSLKNGNVGIGTTAPATKLEVQGTTPSLRVAGTSGTVPSLELSSAGVVNWKLQSNWDAASGFAVLQDATERLVIKSGGNVGIGTTAPHGILEVQGSGNAEVILNRLGVWGSRAAGIKFSTNSDVTDYWTFGMQPDSTNNMYLKKTSNTYMTVLESSGNVGIGTTAPKGKLDVAGGISAGTYAGVNTPPSNGMIISGNVGIGTTSPVKLLDVNGTVRFGQGTTSDADFGKTNFGGYTDVPLGRISTRQVAAGATNGGGAIDFKTFWAGTPIWGMNTVMTLTENGNVGIGDTTPSYQLELSTDSAAKPSTNTWTVPSDARLKTNIIPADLDRCYEIVKSTPLKRFTWKDEYYSAEGIKDRSKLGFIADDVESVFPKAVPVIPEKILVPEVREPDIPAKEAVLDADGNILEPAVEFKKGKLIKEAVKLENMKSLNADQIYAAMYGALQLTISKLEAMEKRLEKLEKKP